MTKNRYSMGSLRLLARSLLAWAGTALVLLLLTALILSRTGTGSAVLGYLNSALSFLSALAAGIAAGGQKGSGGLGQALVTAVTLIILLLGMGFLLADSLNPSGVLSVVSFTLTGVLLGALLTRGRRSPGGSRSWARRKISVSPR